MKSPPKIVANKILQEAERLAEVFYDTNSVRTELVLPINTPLAVLQESGWLLEPFAQMLHKSVEQDNESGSVSTQPRLASVKQLPVGHCYIIAASRPNLSEARAYAQSYTSTIHPLTIYRSSNGWYAISAGTVRKDSAKTKINTMKSHGQLPTDAYCGAGERFIGQVQE